MTRAGLLTALTLLAACSQTPPLPTPRIDLPAHWSDGDQTPTETHSLAEWWLGFGDPVLGELVARALAENRDLALATARLREARASAGIADANLLPAVDARGSGGLRRDDLQAERLGFPQGKQHFHQIGVDASWEIDVFGGRHAAARAAAADADAAAFGLADVQVSLAAEVAREYLALRGAQARLDVARRNVALQEEALSLLDSRVRAGLAPAVDAVKARADLSLLRASQPPLEAAIAGSGFRLAVLSGRAPAALPRELADARPLPDASAAIPLGLPSALLSRRPDLKRAEAAVLAANERAGVARADLLPKFFLSGLLARAEEDNGAVSFGPGLLYSIGPGISLPIFNAGRLRATVQVQDARLAQALAAYEQALLNALAEVETACVDLARERERAGQIAVAVERASLTRALARTRYAKGLTDYFAVIDAQRALQSSEDALALSRTSAAQALVALYKALGGGWQYASSVVQASLAEAGGERQ